MLDKAIPSPSDEELLALPNRSCHRKKLAYSNTLIKDEELTVDPTLLRSNPKILTSYKRVEYFLYSTNRHFHKAFLI